MTVMTIRWEQSSVSLQIEIKSITNSLWKVNDQLNILLCVMHCQAQQNVLNCLIMSAMQLIYSCCCTTTTTTTTTAAAAAATTTTSNFCLTGQFIRHYLRSGRSPNFSEMAELDFLQTGCPNNTVKALTEKLIPKTHTSETHVSW